MSLILFWVLAFLMILSAMFVVANRNPVRSALCLVINMILLAIMYLSLSAQFIAVVQVIVYAGAIMVLFLFVIMLLNLGAPNALKERGGMHSVMAVAVAGLFLILLTGAGAINTGLPIGTATKQFLIDGGTIESIGLALYNPQLPWLFPFEITSFLLLIAVVGAIVLAKRRI